MTASAVLVLLVMYDVKDWLGWAHNNGHLCIPMEVNYRHYYSLQSLNDKEFSFNQIADLIEHGYVLLEKDYVLD